MASSKNNSPELRSKVAKMIAHYEETGMKIDSYYRMKLIEEIARMIEAQNA